MSNAPFPPSELGQRQYPQSWQPLIDKVVDFLGYPPIENVQMDAYNRTPRTNLNLTDIYRGRNMRLRDTIDEMITTNIGFYFTAVLPFSQTEEENFQWNTWEFNHVPAGEVPHEGVSRLVTTQSESFYGSIRRRGLAFKLEVDFYNTDEGALMWYRNCKGIAGCVLDTQAYDTILELLTCKNYQRKWNEIFTTSPESQRTIIQDEISKYACVQKDSNRIFIVFHEYKRIMNLNEGSDPDLLIVPPQSQIYLNLVGAGKTDYYVVGPEGPILKRDGPYSIGMFGETGVRVFETKDFNFDRQGPNIQLLTRAISIGEIYQMTLTHLKGLSSFRQYRSGMRDKYLYDENLDNWQKVTFFDAFRNARIFNSKGEIHPQLKSFLRKAQEAEMVPDSDGIRKGEFSLVDDDDVMDPHKDKNKSSYYFPLFTRTAAGTIDWAEYLGQINLRAATSHDFMRMAESILGKIQPDEGMSDRKDWRTMIELIRNIENQKYDPVYWMELIKTNVASSVNEEGQFIGEKVPNDVRENYNIIHLINEWTPNTYGSLDLPRSKNFKCTYPAGFANPPGFRTIAAEIYCEDSPWREIAKDAQAAIGLLDRIAERLKHTIPSSELINAKNRSPWFHREDAATVLFQAIAPRDPLFLAFLPVSDDSKNRLTPKNKQNKIPVNVAEIVSKKDIGDTVEITLPSKENGKVNVILSTRYVIKKGPLRQMIIPINLGLDTYEKYLDVLTDLKPEEKDALNRALIGFIHSKKEGRKSAARMIYSLASIPEKTERAKKIRKLIDGSKPEISKILKELTEKTPFDDVITLPDLSSDLDELRTTFLQKDGNNIEELQDVVDAYYDLTKSGADGVPEVLDLTKIENYKDYEALYTKMQELLKKEPTLGDVPERDTPPSSVTLPSDDSNEAEQTEFSRTVNVTTDLETMRRAVFYRAPLTNSLTLLKTTAMQNIPLIHPSDPTSGHYSDYTFGDGNSIHPNIYQRPQYAHIDEINKRGSQYITANTFGVIEKSRKYDPRSRISGKNNLSVSGGKRKMIEARTFVDDDNEMEEDDPFKVDKEESMLRRGERTSRNTSWNLRDLEGRGNRIDDKRMPFDDPIFGDLNSDINNPVFTARYKRIFEDISDDVTRLVAVACMFMKNDGMEWLRAIENDVCVPINILLWRLGITHDMSTYIMMKGGIETGANFWGHTNFMISSDGSSKMILGNFTFNSKALVYNEKNVRLIENVKSERYRGGNNTAFMRMQDMNDRSLSRGSIIATAIPVTEEKFRDIMNFTGKHHQAVYNRDIDGDDEIPHYSTYQYYDGQIWKLFERVPASEGEYRYPEKAAFGGTANVVALTGTQADFDITSGRFSSWTLCKGHRGPNGSYPGAAGVWNGQLDYFKQVDFSSYILV